MKKKTIVKRKPPRKPSQLERDMKAVLAAVLRLEVVCSRLSGLIHANQPVVSSSWKAKPLYPGMEPTIKFHDPDSNVSSTGGAQW